MTSLKKAYPGRLIFDHLPKTAGQAINAWLMSELGTGCVTPNLIGDHSELIRQYGGSYSVISAHIQFDDGEGPDPRYQYITLFREPVDRVASWLFFVINNHDDSQLPALRQQVNRFLDNNENTPSLAHHVSNAYVEHFCRIEGSGTESDEIKIRNALSAIKKYDVVGLYDDIPLFLSEVSSLIGLPTPKKLPSVNVTKNRLLVDELSPALRERIIAINQLDIRLFEELVAWKKSSITEQPLLAPLESLWAKHQKNTVHSILTNELLASSASVREGTDISHGQLISLDMDIFLTREITELETEIHIFDAKGQCAFETNSTLLGQTHQAVLPGEYRVTYHLIVDLPIGRYAVGFGFSEKLPHEVKKLFWRHAMCDFEVLRPAEKFFEGYCYLPTGVNLSPKGPVGKQVVVKHHAGCLQIVDPLPHFNAGELIRVNVEVLNSSDQVWLGNVFLPINFSYHWLTATGEMFLFDGLRTPTPEDGFVPGMPCNAEVQIQSPGAAGTYVLILTLVQEMVGWFEEKGFQAACHTVTVTAEAPSA